MPVDIDAILAASPTRGYGAPLPGYTSDRVNAEALEQTEIVGLRELHTLAAKLTRRNSPRHQMLGRALAKALAGEPFAQKGARDVTLYQIAGEIIEQHPFCAPETVLPHFAAVISRVQELGSKLTLEKFHRHLETQQSKKQGKAETLRTIGETVAMPEPGAPTPPPIDAASGVPPLVARGVHDVIVVADGSYYLRNPESEIYHVHFKNEQQLRLELIRSYGSTNSVLNTHDQMGRMYTTELLLAQYGTNARKIIKDFCTDATRFDMYRGVLRMGQRMIDAAEFARDDLAVELWLKDLVGGTDAALSDLYDWIAATDQRYILRPSVALALVGPRDSAKSFFAKALAHTWGVIAPPKLTESIDRFNSSVAECPIWLADEELPKDFTGHVFRELVQSRERLIEPKGREKLLLIGSPRIIITANQIEDIRIRGANGPEAVEAIADRLSIFQCVNFERMRESLDRIKIPGSYDLDVDRIVRHLRAIQTHVTPREQRFYGGRGDKETSRLPVLHAAMDQLDELFELLYRWLIDPEPIEKEYHDGGRSFVEGGREFPIVSQDGAIYVRPSEIAQRLRKPEWQIKGSIKAFERSPRGEDEKGRQQLKLGRLRVRFARLDPDKLFAALRLTGDALDRACRTVGISTRERLSLQD